MKELIRQIDHQILLMKGYLVKDLENVISNEHKLKIVLDDITETNIMLDTLKVKEVTNEI